MEDGVRKEAFPQRDLKDFFHLGTETEKSSVVFYSVNCYFSESWVCGLAVTFFSSALPLSFNSSIAGRDICRGEGCFLPLSLKEKIFAEASTISYIIGRSKIVLTAERNCL